MHSPIVTDQGSFGLDLRSGVSVALSKSQLSDTGPPQQHGGKSLEGLCPRYIMEREQGTSQDTVASEWRANG